MGKALCFDADGKCLKPNRSRIAVFKGFRQTPFHYIKPKAAAELVKRGHAEFIEDGPYGRAIRLIAIVPVAPSSVLLACGQGDTYEKAAIERNRKYAVGGLNRTEHNPAPFNRFSGAKVGHQ